MGNSTSSSITKQDRAILQLKKQRDALKQHQKKVTFAIAHDTDLAKSAVAANDPQRAKFYLKLKRQQSDMLTKVQGQLETIEGLIGTIEFKLVEKEVMDSLQQGNQVLKELNSQVSVEKVDEIMDTMNDEQIRTAEVTDALGLGGFDYDVEDELAALEREANPPTKTSVAPPTKVAMPDAPESEPQSLPQPPTHEPQSPQKQAAAPAPLPA
ncbi:hypothetical protein DIURU_001345 [Diutina rugosa]|uniref:Charged multivesicular body protein 6 n=1 Tax=Diutina rugosa TaxID=5481 RepID=A0A642UUK6_DIURU|nr:uncharacterized protein DIURU_001345 [Diutina rugosa]KAA8905809.1 hypothetical protein DIURU_001345 [Diutina rugosa]